MNSSTRTLLVILILNLSSTAATNSESGKDLNRISPAEQEKPLIDSKQRLLASDNTRILVSYFGSFLRAYPNGKVDLSQNKQEWEQWRWVWIRGNMFNWQSYHGTFLSSNPDGRVTLVSTPKEWELWEKIPGNGYNYWKSYHGTYLKANPNGLVELTKVPQEWERWSELTPSTSASPQPSTPNQPSTSRPNISGRNLVIRNNCSFTIWPGMSGVVHGSGQPFFGRANSSNPGGFELGPNTERIIPIPKGVDGMRVWARTGCSRQTNPAWPEPKTRLICEVGECGNPNNQWDGTCFGSGGEGANTLAEFTVEPSGVWWYDVSLVDGFSLPVSVKPFGNPVNVQTTNPKFSCGAPSCRPDFSKCPPEILKKSANGNNLGCFSLSKAINDGALRSKTPALNNYFNNKTIRSHIECSCGVGSCAGGTREEVLRNIRNGPRNAIMEDTTGFCCSPDNPLYEFAGISSHICRAADKPRPLNGFGGGKRYDEVFKDICPDAYSWEFDDNKSTYLCQGDNLSFEVSFC